MTYLDDLIPLHLLNPQDLDNAYYFYYVENLLIYQFGAKDAIQNVSANVGGNDAIWNKSSNLCTFFNF